MSATFPRNLTAYRVSVGSHEIVIFSYRLEYPLLDALTAAEREVVLEAAQGLSNLEIAKRRNRSARTIANQLASAFRKLGIRSRRELVALLARDDPMSRAIP